MIWFVIWCVCLAFAPYVTLAATALYIAFVLAVAVAAFGVRS